MKTILKSGFTVLFFALFFVANLKSQQLAITQLVSKSALPTFLGSSLKNVNMEMVRTAKLSPKFYTRFNRTFNYANNVKWEPLENHTIIAKFMTGQISNVVLVGKNGRAIYWLSYYSENQIPEDIKKLVMNSYDDYKIMDAIKIVQGSLTVWEIKLAGQFHYKTVRIQDGEMDEIESLIKSH